MDGGIAPDGSPVDVYLAQPAGDAPDLIHDALGGPGSLLELGSGPGRLTRPLTRLGHSIVAVDNSADMLHHVDCAETVLGDVFTLDLGRTFDAVLLASHLINVAHPARRDMLLAACRRHVAAGGAVVVQRYDGDWADDPTPKTAMLGPVSVTTEPIAVAAGGFAARATFRLGDRTWVQDFSAASLSDDAFAAEAGGRGLLLTRWLDPRRTWGLLTAV